MKKLFPVYSIILITVFLLTACAQPTSAPVIETEVPLGAPTEAAKTAEPVTEMITLVVWDQFYRDVESQVMDTLNAEFEAAHNGVKIERVVKTLDDLKVTLKLALAQSDGPDIAQVNQGRSDMG